MKTVRTWIFLGVMVAGLLRGHASLRAQPASEPVPAGGEPAPTEDEPIVIDDPDKPWSQGVALESRMAARELFLEGNRLIRIPLFARAADQYVAALSKWKHPAFYFNLAFAQINLGQEVEARESLEHAMAHGEEPLGAKRFQEAQKQLQEVKRQLGRIRLSCRTPGAEVTLDGATVFIGPGSYEGWIKAKSHELTAKKVGYQAEARRATVSAGELLNVDLSLVTLTQAADTSRRWAAWKPWAVVAAGVTVASAGGALHTLASRNFNAYDEQFLLLDCVTMPDPELPGCRKRHIGRELNARLGRARLQQTIAVGAYVAGGSLVATGLVLLYLNRPRLAESATRLSTRNVTVVPAASGDMLGILVSVSH